MPYYLFTEDENGKLGHDGKEFFSRVEVDSAAEDYPGIAHIIEADNLLEAKRKLKEKLAKKGNLNSLYKNVRRERR